MWKLVAQSIRAIDSASSIEPEVTVSLADEPWQGMEPTVLVYRDHALTY